MQINRYPWCKEYLTVSATEMEIRHAYLNDPDSMPCVASRNSQRCRVVNDNSPPPLTIQSKQFHATNAATATTTTTTRRRRRPPRHRHHQPHKPHRRRRHHHHHHINNNNYIKQTTTTTTTNKQTNNNDNKTNNSNSIHNHKLQPHVNISQVPVLLLPEPAVPGDPRAAREREPGVPARVGVRPHHAGQAQGAARNTTRTRTRTRARTHTHTHTHTHTRTRTHTNTQAHAHAHTRTRTRTRACL